MVVVVRLSRGRFRWDRYPYRAPKNNIPEHFCRQQISKSVEVCYSFTLEVLTLRLAMRTVNPFPSGQDVSSTSTSISSTSLRGKTPRIKEKEVQVFRGALITLFSWVAQRQSGTLLKPWLWERSHLSHYVGACDEI